MDVKQLAQAIVDTFNDRSFRQKAKDMVAPDVVVVESFAYNHWSGSQQDVDKQWVTLGKISDAIRGSGAREVFLATIAPNRGGNVKPPNAPRPPTQPEAPPTALGTY